ncbi:MAG TPA: HAMP domain-containing protein [Candidatus Gallacutalibacter stercoravium]|nr:HAMP domain-containing protein [Candidatus Gallacutalibacter stercoravium]
MRKRITLVSIGVVTVALVVSFLLAMPLVESLYREEFSKRMDTLLTLMASDLASIREDPQEFAQQESEMLLEAGQDVRVTIIGQDGTVLGEAQAKVDTPQIEENHLQRPEVQQARQGGIGYDIRVSDSVGIRYYYAASYAQWDGGGLYIRAAMPMDELDEVLASMRVCMLVGVLVGAAVALVFSMLASRGLSQPLTLLTEAARHIADGDLGSRVDEGGADEIGELAQAFNQMVDTTQKAIGEMDSERRLLEGVLQGMDDGVLAVDSDGGVLVFNERAKELLDTPDLQEGGRLEGSLALTQLGGLIAQARDEDGVVHGEINMVSPSRELTVYAAPLNAGEISEGALAVVADVTEMRRLQRLRSEFVANVTHELKTPLTSIRGFIELLKSGDRDEETRKYFYDVLDIEAERLQHLIEDMLVLSRIENAKGDDSAIQCDLRRELLQTVHRLEPEADKQKVTLETGRMDEGLLVNCTPMRLQQMFGNLVENAIKYNKPGGKVTVTAQGQKGMAVVRVKDTGIGIAPEHLGRVFERFYRVDSSRSREIGGTGLGLSIVKHLAGLYGGDVSVESIVGRGSTFTVRLPLLLTARPEGQEGPLKDKAE